MSNRSISYCLLVACICLCSTSVVLAEDGRIIGMQFVMPLDGPCEQFYIVNRGGVIELMTPEQAQPLLAHLAGAARVTDNGLVPQQIASLPESIGDITFQLTNHVNARREFILDIIERFVNGMSGSSKKPRVVVQPDSINLDHYTSYQQIISDGLSTMYAFPDDRTFMYTFRGKVAASAHVYFDLETGVFNGIDIALTYAFLNDAYYEYLVSTLPHEFGHIFGYRHIGWVEDCMSYRHVQDLDTYFWNEESFIWQNSKLKDRMVYDGIFRKGKYRAKVKILPTPGSVIDIEYLKTTADNANRQGHIIVLTTLKGYRRKPLEMKIYRGTKIRDKWLILSISGINRDILTNSALLEKYTVNDIAFMRPEDFALLEQAVIGKGVPKTFHDLHYDYALLTTVVVTGWDGPDSVKPRTLSVPLWFVKQFP